MAPIHHDSQWQCFPHDLRAVSVPAGDVAGPPVHDLVLQHVHDLLLKLRHKVLVCRVVVQRVRLKFNRCEKLTIEREITLFLVIKSFSVEW